MQRIHSTPFSLLFFLLCFLLYCNAASVRLARDEDAPAIEVGGDDLDIDDTAIPITLSERDVVEDTELYPIKERDLEELGIDERAIDEDEDYSGLDLSDHLRMIFGRPQKDGSFFMANMTLLSPDGTPLILMERFDPMVKSATCDAKTGNITLSFKSAAAMRYAIAAWDWINENATDHFILIANSDSCGPANQRAPYYVYDVDYDEEKFVTYLNAYETTWSKVGHTFSIDYGSLSTTPPALTRRWSLIPTLNYNPSGTLSLNTPRRAKVNLWTDHLRITPRFVIDCLNCYVAGSIHLQGHVAVKGFSLNALSATIKPRDVMARLQLQLGLSKPFTEPFQKTLVSVPIAGIKIPKIFQVGPKLNVVVGVDVTSTYATTFTLGAIARIPNTASITADLKSRKSSGAPGWSGTSITAIPLKIKSGKISAGIFAYMGPQLSVGFNVLSGKFSAKAALKIKAGIKANGTSTFESGGVCKSYVKKYGSSGAKKFAVVLQKGLAVDGMFSLSEDKDVGAKTWFEAKLFGITKKLADVCLKLPR